LRLAAEGFREAIVAPAPDLASLAGPGWQGRLLWREGVTAVRFGARVRGPLACLAILLLLGAGSRPVEAQEPCRPNLEEWQRYGFVALRADWATAFAVDTLNAGWYVNPVQPTPHHPGMDQSVVIRTPSGYTLDPATLGPLVDANPGATWIIGSEPDCIWQDDVLPEGYARIYHDLYHFVKNRDQTSQVAAGGIVQPTPLRLAYLDRVLAEYQARYGQPLPVDLWHIHNAILNEERGGWGADIPPGIAANQGVIRSIDDNDSMVIFQEQVWAFRQWMADRGYGGYPLIITEYGILMPDDFGFDIARVNQFMTETFAFLSTAADAVLGDASDNGRLVQRWAWFSLDERPFNGETGFNGNLFNPDTMERTAHGDHYASLTASLHPLLRADLGLGRWRVVPLPAVVTLPGTVDQPVQVRLVNAGTAESGAFQVRLSYAGPVSGSLTQPVDNLGPQAAQWITMTLPGLVVGRYDLTLEVDVYDQVPEQAECNNEASHGLVVPTARLYLPLVGRENVSGVQGGVSTSVQLVPRAPEPSSPEADEPTAGVAALPVWTEYPLPHEGSYPGQLALDETRGFLWVTERDGDRIARLDVAAEPPEWQEYPLAPDSQPWGLALDAAGVVWFAESGADKIGKLGVSDTLIEYEGLTAGSQPWGVALDGDGLVWFTERAAGQIGRLEPASGEVVEYALPAGDTALPGGIAVHGDYVWLAETGAGQLGRFRISKQEVYENAPSDPWEGTLINPADVAVNSIGNPWLTNTGGDGISQFRFSTAQLFWPILVRTKASEPYGITVSGSSGAIWFTERAGNRVGRHDPPESVVEYRLPTPGSQPTDIVVDGDGCVWVAAPGANQVLHLCFQPGDYFTYMPLVLR
jgi:streptogramin lyase